LTLREGGVAAQVCPFARRLVSGGGVSAEASKSSCLGKGLTARFLTSTGTLTSASNLVRTSSAGSSLLVSLCSFAGATSALTLQLLLANGSTFLRGLTDVRAGVLKQTRTLATKLLLLLRWWRGALAGMS